MSFPVVSLNKYKARANTQQQGSCFEKDDKIGSGLGLYDYGPKEDVFDLDYCLNGKPLALELSINCSELLEGRMSKHN